MKRCWICIGLLTGLLGMCIGSLLCLRAQCRQYASLTEEVIANVQDGDTDAALLAFDTLEQNWDKFHDICGLFVNGEELNPIREVLTELRPLIAQEHPEAASCLEKLRQLVEGIYEEQLPVFWHIL